MNTDGTAPQIISRLRHIQSQFKQNAPYIAKVISAPKGMDVTPYVWVFYAGMGEVSSHNLRPEDVADVERLLAEGTYLKLRHDTFTMPVYFDTHVADLVVQGIDLI